MPSPATTTPEAVLVRPASPKTMGWLHDQVTAIRLNRGRNLGCGPFVDALLSGIQESGSTFVDCHGRSDVAAKICRHLTARYQGVK
jgi:hypothetical protein